MTDVKAPIRVLVVDDSAIMRSAIERALQGQPDLQVVGAAANGAEALARIHELNPDVVTLDVAMPVMDGLECLGRLMSTAPTRVLMVSSLTTADAEPTLRALEMGAIDFLPKPADANGAVQLTRLAKALPDRIRTVAAANLEALGVAPGARRDRRARPQAADTDPSGLILIGASTGGPRALQTVLGGLHGDLEAAVLIVQHLPAAFTRQLAARLDQTTQLQVREAKDGDRLRRGQVLLAPGDHHLVLQDRRRVRLTDEPADTVHRPSVDVLFASAAQVYEGAIVAVVLTGMGDDGMTGARELKARGAAIIAQDEQTAAVYGMPGSVIEAGLAGTVCPLSLIPAAIERAFNR